MAHENSNNISNSKKNDKNDLNVSSRDHFPLFIISFTHAK